MDLTWAQRKLLLRAAEGPVMGEGRQRRMCERLADAGLLSKVGLQQFEITAAGRAEIGQR